MRQHQGVPGLPSRRERLRRYAAWRRVMPKQGDLGSGGNARGWSEHTLPAPVFYRVLCP